jgi:hypothetical protein
MTKEEAIKMLESAIGGSSPSKINRNLTRSQGIDIVRKAIEPYKDGAVLNRLFEKRVWQVCKNQKRPHY